MARVDGERPDPQLDKPNLVRGEHAAVVEDQVGEEFAFEMFNLGRG